MSEPLAPTPQLDTIPFAVLIDDAWKSTRAWARRILVPAAVMLAPAALLVQVLVGLWNLSLVRLDPGNFEPARFCGTLAIGFAGFMVIGVYFAAVYGCVMVTTIRALGGATPSMRDSLRFYMQPRVWGTDLLAWFLTGLGLCACILPGLFLLAAWSLRLPIMVREGRYGWSALGRSWELLGHNPSRQLFRHPLLKVLLLFVLGAVLGYAVSMLIQAPALIVNQVMMMRAMTRGEAVDAQALVRATLWLSIPAGVLAALAQLAVQLYVDFATAHLYLDQVRRKEGADLGRPRSPARRRDARRVADPAGPRLSEAAMAMAATPLAPPPWTAADPAAMRQAFAQANPSRQLPGPSFGEYLYDLGRWMQERMVGAIGKLAPWIDSSILGRVAFYTAITAASLAALSVVVMLVRRWRSLRAERAGLQTAVPLDAAPAPSPTGDAAWWRAELGRRLAAGALRPALEAAWWWTARRLDPPGLDSSWTTGELLRRSGAAALRVPLRRLDRQLWGGDLPRRDEVEAVVTELDRGPG